MEHDKKELLAMKLGDVWEVENSGSLHEIHRVFGGWIYVFTMSNSLRATSSFVPEELEVVTRKRYDNVPG